MKELKFQPIKDTNAFSTRFDEIKNVYKEAFSGFPWNSEVTDEEAEVRIKDHIDRRGFTGYKVEDRGKIVGGLWYNLPTLEELYEERGVPLRDFTNEKMISKNINDILFIRETIVLPSYQGRGIASSLRKTFYDDIESVNTDGLIILTRHRDDNLGIVKISQKYGFERTGVHEPSRSNPDTKNEYWYKILSPNNKDK